MWIALIKLKETNPPPIWGDSCACLMTGVRIKKKFTKDFCCNIYMIELVLPTVKRRSKR
jgi:hypothetical protein